MQVQRQIDDLLAQRASEWLEILKNAGEFERAAFVDWLCESRLHVQEFLEIVAVDRELHRIDPNRSEDIDALLAQIAPGVVMLNRSPPPARSRRTMQSTSRKWTKWAMMVAALAILAILPLQPYFFESREFSTVVGEQRTIELQDASLVQLNADSQIKVQLTKTERTIQLLHGEAMFKVAHDPQRPFRVQARAGSIQAVGTQFNVYDQPDGTRVSVLEGRVAVTAGASSRFSLPSREKENSVLLGAGEEALITLGGAIQQNHHANVDRAVAWRERRLIFDNAALEDMVREFNRYNGSLKIELQGVPRGSHHYEGIFDADDPESLANLLSRETDLTVERRAGAIVVRGR